MGSVAYHPCEDFTEISGIAVAARTYIKKDIGNLYKMNFIEFINMPTYMVEILTEVATEEESKKAAEINKINNELK